MSKFIMYPDFPENVRKASNKSRSSLRPLFDEVRKATDKIYFDVRQEIQGEMGRAEGDMQAYKSKRFSTSGKKNYAHAKAKHAALKTAFNSVFPMMDYDGKEILGRVVIGRKYSFTLEFGGPDPVAEIGKGTGEHVVHPAYSFLRRAINS